MTSDSPSAMFDAPPLFEVSYSLQFEPIEDLHLGLFGLMWDLYRDRYQRVSHDNELAHQIEKFGVIPRELPSFQFLKSAPFPRIKFESDDDQFLIQLQRDRFIFNWRNLDGLFEYPRYDRLKEKFLQEFGVFESFLLANSLKSPSFDQVEFTYVNHMEVADLTVGDVFNAVVHSSSFSNELELESFSLNLKHLIKRDGDSLGRIYATMEKVDRKSDGVALYVLKFLTRTHPMNTTLDGVIEVMDIMRDEINRDFLSLTTPKMHKKWKQIVD